MSSLLARRFTGISVGKGGKYYILSLIYRNHTANKYLSTINRSDSSKKNRNENGSTVNISADVL